VLATWHAYAKLRVHTETTLGFFDTTTTALGQALRRFTNTTCKAFVTKELPREEAAHGRRKAAAAAKDKGKGKAPAEPTKRKGKKKDGANAKLFNMLTYKLHALGDYVKNTWLYGTTDNYSTQVVSAFFVPALHSLTTPAG
jgi:hypothetical protein